MATLVLSTVGDAVGTAFGGPVGGAIGRIVGAFAGASLDRALAGSGQKARHVQGPHLADVAGLTSTEGDPIPRVYGRARIGGTLIWATRPLEVANTTVQRAASPSKGSGGAKTVTTTYAYYANLAVGLCEGPSPSSGGSGRTGWRSTRAASPCGSIRAGPTRQRTR